VKREIQTVFGIKLTQWMLSSRFITTLFLIQQAFQCFLGSPSGGFCSP